MKKIKIKPAHMDERGSIWDLLTNETTHHIGLLISKKNSIRGKHFHKKQKQYTLVLSGKIRITAKNLLDENSNKEIFDLNEMEMVLLPPFYYHSLEAIQDSRCLIFTTISRDDGKYEEDTFRVADIDSFKFSE